MDAQNKALVVYFVNDLWALIVTIGGETPHQITEVSMTVAVSEMTFGFCRQRWPFWTSWTSKRRTRRKKKWRVNSAGKTTTWPMNCPFGSASSPVFSPFSMSRTRQHVPGSFLWLRCFSSWPRYFPSASRLTRTVGYPWYATWRWQIHTAIWPIGPWTSRKPSPTRPLTTSNWCATFGSPLRSSSGSLSHPPYQHSSNHRSIGSTLLPHLASTQTCSFRYQA